MSRRRKYLLVAAILVVILLGAYFGGLLQAITGASTTSVFCASNGNCGAGSYDDSARGISWRGYYQGYTEIFDSAQYVTAWTADGHSEKILGFMQHQFGLTGWEIDNAPGSDTFSPGNAYAFDLFINGDHYTTIGYAETGNTQSSGWTNIPVGPLYMDLKGPVTGVLTVNVYAYEHDSVNPFNPTGWVKIGHDEANLISGAGSCSLTGVAGVTRPAKPGEALTVSCDIGYAASSKSNSAVSGGWTLWQDSTQVASLGNGPGLGVVASFPAASQTGVHTLRLFNTLFSVDAYDFSVTVNPDQAPPKPSVTTDPAPPWMSNAAISVSWHADVNSVTQSPIKTVHVHVFYTNGDNILKADFPGAEGSTTFTIGKDTDIRISVISEDQNGEFSLQNEVTYQVNSCDLYNKCNPYTPLGTFDALAVLFFLGAGAALALTGFFVKRIPGLIRVAMVLGGIALFAFGLYIAIVWLIAIVTAWFSSLFPHF